LTLSDFTGQDVETEAWVHHRELKWSQERIYKEYNLHNLDSTMVSIVEPALANRRSIKEGKRTPFSFAANGTDCDILGGVVHNQHQSCFGSNPSGLADDGARAYKKHQCCHSTRFSRNR
jgi:hypothetical protein